MHTLRRMSAGRANGMRGCGGHGWIRQLTFSTLTERIDEGAELSEPIARVTLEILVELGLGRKGNSAQRSRAAPSGPCLGGRVSGDPLGIFRRGGGRSSRGSLFSSFRHV